jgi:hypothetical protein
LNVYLPYGRYYKDQSAEAREERRDMMSVTGARKDRNSIRKRKRKMKYTLPVLYVKEEVQIESYRLSIRESFLVQVSIINKGACIRSVVKSRKIAAVQHWSWR